jgi:hypothetical protein
MLRPSAAARPLALDETVDLPLEFQPGRVDKRPTTRQRGLTLGRRTAATIRPIIEAAADAGAARTVISICHQPVRVPPTYPDFVGFRQSGTTGRNVKDNACSGFSRRVLRVTISLKRWEGRHALVRLDRSGAGRGVNCRG